MKRITALQEIRNVIDECDHPNKEDLLEVLDMEISNYLKHKETQCERNYEKRLNDPIRAKIVGLMTEEDPLTADQICALINEEEVTKPKITARCTQLVKEGILRKEPILVNSKKYMGYFLAKLEEE